MYKLKYKPSNYNLEGFIINIINNIYNNKFRKNNIMDKFNQTYLKLLNNNKHIIKEEFEVDKDDERLKIDKILKLCKIDITPAIEKLQDKGYVDGVNEDVLRDYIEEVFGNIDINDVLNYYKLALINKNLNIVEDFDY